MGGRVGGLASGQVGGRQVVVAVAVSVQRAVHTNTITQSLSVAI